MIKIKETATSVWKWLDKKKTIIGTVALIASKYFPEHTVTHQVLSAVGEIFGYIGIAHKAIKKDYGKLPSGLSSERLKKILRETFNSKEK
jgi:hypothetical protein